MPEIEERTAKIEGILEQMSERITDLREDLSKRIDDLRAEVSNLRAEVSNMRADFTGLRADFDSKIEGLAREIHDNFRWTMATLIGSWATIVGVIIAMFAIVR